MKPGKSDYVHGKNKGHIIFTKLITILFLFSFKINNNTNSLITTMGEGRIRTMVLLIKNNKLCYRPTKLLATTFF